MDPKVAALTNEWFKYADQDLQAAQKLLGEFNHITCFHCQQAAEKYIKGILVSRQIDFRKTHDLAYLLDLLKQTIPDEISAAAEFLTEYAVEARYPGDFSNLTSVEAEKAIFWAEKIRDYMATYLA